jgi:hypothetical protein
MSPYRVLPAQEVIEKEELGSTRNGSDSSARSHRRHDWRSGPELQPSRKGRATPLPAGARVWFYVAGPSSSAAWVGSTPVEELPARTAGWYAFNWTIPTDVPLGACSYRAQVWTGTFAIDANAVSFALPPYPFVKPEGLQVPSPER